MVLQAIKYSRVKLEILDQLRLPHEKVYNEIKSLEDAWIAIKSMQVRGAPAIAIVAALSIAAIAARQLRDMEPKPPAASAKDAAQHITSGMHYLLSSRPTAVNLADAATKLSAVVKAIAEKLDSTSVEVFEAYIEAAERMLVDDVQDNERIGKYGAHWIMQNKAPGITDTKVSVITHCNTGSLATAGYGTALGVIRSLHSSNSLRHVYYTETRPYNQGSRLTGYELIHDEIPATLITDSMAAALMRTKSQSENIAAVIVGADRVAANGDTANKIGTYALAILAHHHGIKFLVAAPRTTVDMATKSGADIVIEERPEIEVLNIKGPTVQANASGDKEIVNGSTVEICIAARNSHAWNPAFDITPAELIDGIITEKGVVEKDDQGVFQWNKVFDASDIDDLSEVEEAKGLNLLPDGVTPAEPIAAAS
ncbi:MAG: hypothetical protein Q9186_004071 [Xanthomendoza sp. 1 TL-2023]